MELKRSPQLIRLRSATTAFSPSFTLCFYVMSFSLQILFTEYNNSRQDKKTQNVFQYVARYCHSLVNSCTS